MAPRIPALPACIVLALLFCAWPREAAGCASCGSGSGSPLVLYPNEGAKAYLGLSDQSMIESIGADGQVSRSIQPERKSSLTVAAGFRPFSRLSLVFTQPYQRNTAASRSMTAAADPSIEARWTVAQGAWDRPLIPQVQMIAAHKISMARSIHRTADPRLIDVFGNGFDESTIGADAWWNMVPLKPGIAVMGSHSWARSYGGIEIRRGIRTQIVLGIGHTFLETMHLNGGFRVEFKAKDENDGRVIGDSEGRQNDAFFSCRHSSGLHEIKASIYATGLGGGNKNALRSRSMTVGYAKAI